MNWHNVKLNMSKWKAKWRAMWKRVFASKAAAPEVSFVLWAGSEREAIQFSLEQMKQANTQSEWIVATEEAWGELVIETVGKIADKTAKAVKVLSLHNGISRYAALSRAAGEARGNKIVFLEAAGAPEATTIWRFIHALEQGADVALNPAVKPAGKWRVSNETLAAYTFNAFLGRQDLQGATMLNLPFALSQRALAAIGKDGLAKPVMALAKAVNQGLRVEAVPIFPLKPTVQDDQAPPDYHQEQIILGDTLEAVHWLIRKQGNRAGFTDLGRRRGRVGR